ncbi:gluconate 2-dehydrogenase subunit 3 family protein [Stutzerimonas kirkiae]|uniref:gluconate 2-dehydrogenase subunit 3 family protein n=1 Tax=Stutzerimonas kirkiae TaxID=2211392 RepID=UPI00103830C2|nr:gluconate 2-dehydrogenase subunit 3 family protein [Stutzerimonas kirkiae]TBV06970.1 gluconate 2-dehydrogenase [Stutzerimonas kirkiae]
MSEKRNAGLTRRQLLLSSAGGAALGAVASAQAATIAGIPAWNPFDHNAPLFIDKPGWQFFSAAQAREVEAIVERLIPADELSASGKDAGCAVFIDRQLAGAYGGFERQYMEGPFQPGTAAQGDQSPLVPRERYRLGLAALEQYCQAQFGASFSALDDERRDAILAGLERGEIELLGIVASLFFAQILGNTLEGFFADPIYGGNRDMLSWRMLGFPGARYDYREHIARHNQKLDLEPLSIIGSSAWNRKG